jgi:hypothetical protein
MLETHDRRGGILTGLLVSGLILLCLCAAGGIYIARHTRISSVSRGGGDDVSIDTPAGRLNVQANNRFDAAQSGLPEYPGATRKKDPGGAVLEWAPNSDNSDKNFAVSAEELETPDPADRVVEWYRAQLPGWKLVKERGQGPRFESGEGGHKRIVAVEEKHGYTRIGLVSIGEPPTN